MTAALTCDRWFCFELHQESLAIVCSKSTCKAAFLACARPPLNVASIYRTLFRTSTVANRLGLVAMPHFDTTFFSEDRGRSHGVLECLFHLAGRQPREKHQTSTHGAPEVSILIISSNHLLFLRRLGWRKSHRRETLRETCREQRFLVGFHFACPLCPPPFDGNDVDDDYGYD